MPKLCMRLILYTKFVLHIQHMHELWCITRAKAMLMKYPIVKVISCLRLAR